jgi:hypothetical protein
LHNILLNAVNSALGDRSTLGKLGLAPAKYGPARSDLSSELHWIGHLAVRRWSVLTTLWHVTSNPKEKTPAGLPAGAYCLFFNLDQQIKAGSPCGYER